MMQINSFRDPDGRVYINDKHVLRIVTEKKSCFFRDFFTSAFSQKLVAERKLVNTKILNDNQVENLLEQKQDLHSYFHRNTSLNNNALIVEHEKIPFISYPYEWPIEMLHAAGILTIEIAIESSKSDLGIKDTTPYNILFIGAKPIFIDALSFEEREQGDYTWLAYAQFIRMFYLPLIVNKYFGISVADSLFNHRDGLEPNDVYQLCSFTQKISSPFLTMISIPKWLANSKKTKNGKLYHKKIISDIEKAKFIYQSLLKRLQKALKELLLTYDRKSVWSDYMQSNNNYLPEELSLKSDLIERFLNEFSPQKVLDVGCNTGHFSFLAARHGASVVAIDYDPVVVGKVWCQAYKENLDILPLHINISRPTPSIGWRNKEGLSFLERAQGYFDTVFMLAVIHHLLVSERIPLEEIVDLAAELTTMYLVVEYVDPEDSMFKILTRGREDLYSDLTPETFLETCLRRFDIVDSMPISGTKRCIYILCKKGFR